MSGRGSVVAIVPAKDAAATIGDVVRSLLGIEPVSEVVVVDDGSSDDTATAARQAGAWVLRLPANRGKGAAVAAGVALAPHAGTYLLIDADVGATASAAAGLLEPVLAGDADMAVGVLPSAGGMGGFGLVRRVAAAGIGMASGTQVQAPLSGQRAVRGELLRSLDVAPRFGLEVGLTVDAQRAGARVVEIAVTMDHRHTGRTVAGFCHRAHQGDDVLRALWPRVTHPATRMGLIGLALAIALVAVLGSGSRWEPSSVALGPGVERVLVVGMPGLRWDEVGTGRLPNLDRLLDHGAVAAMSVRTLSGNPEPAEAYATLGAGARVRVGDAADEATGEDGPVLVPAVETVRRDAGRHVPSKPGALGDALHAAGLRTAVVGNADTPSGLVGLTGVDATRRPAAAAVMDSSGRIDAGSVEPGDLLVTDHTAAFSERADPDRVLARTAEAFDQADVVVVDPGDLDRAAALNGIAPAGYAARIRGQALDWTDALLGRLVEAAPPGTLVLVASPVPPTDEWRLTPVVASGPGVAHGYLHSPSTRRLGLVTLTDLAPSVLTALGAHVPPGMVGHALRSHPGTPDVESLGRLDRDTAFREQIYLPVALGFVAFQVGFYLLIAAMLARRQGGRRPAWRERRGWKAYAGDVALGIAAFPLATLLFRAATPWAAPVGWPGVALLPVLVVLIVMLGRWARPAPLAPFAWVLGATVWLIVADIATGGRLQVGGILGYSPQSAGRYFGLGNAGFAVLAACAVLAAALHVDHAPRRREALVAAAAFFALVVVVDGAPSLGGDVGGILTLVPVFGLTLVAMSGRRLSWGLALRVAGVAVAVLAAATAVDLLRPRDARTHLGRLAADTWHDGAGELLATVGRRVEANARLVWTTPWAWAILLIVAGLLYALVAHKEWTGRLPLDSPLRAGIVGALAAGVVGFVLNDSGVVVTLLALVAVSPVLAVLALAQTTTPRPVLLEPSADAPARLSGRGALGPGAVAGLRGPNAVDGLRGPNAIDSVRGPNAADGLHDPNVVDGP